MQEFSDAVHKFQRDFSDKTRRVVFQFKATKRHMEATQIQLQVQFALIELAQEQKLQGQFYWPSVTVLLLHEDSVRSVTIKRDLVFRKGGEELGRHTGLTEG